MTIGSVTTVRDMVPADVSVVAAMVRDVLTETWHNPATLPDVIERNGSIDAWRRYLDTRQCFVALHVGRIVGAAWVFIVDKTAHVGGAFARHRGEGIGRLLLDARLRHATELGCESAQATVVVGNVASRANLERAGFTLSNDDGREWTFVKSLRSKVDAVLLDVGGVFVVPHPEPVGAALAGLCEIDGESAERAHYVGVAAVDVSPAADPLLDYLTSYVAALGVADHDVDTAVKRLTGIWTQPSVDLWRQVVNGSVQGLVALSASGVKLGVVSNSDGTVEQQLHQHGICQIGKGPGVPVVAVLDSAVVGVAKPDPAIFSVALHALDVEASRAIFVGDSFRFDVAGAANSGITGVHLDPHGFCALPDGHLHVRNLTELRDLLTDRP